MSSIWRHDGDAWGLLGPAGFPDEAALHDLVEDAPQLLPLSGTPRIIVVGREVSLGGSYADLIAVEPDGRIVVVEVKLARNAEARRAVVAQILAYAAFMHGLEIAELEQEVLGRSLRAHGHVRLVDAVGAADESGTFNPTDFQAALAKSLAAGAFRLVLVLDEAPAQLVRLVGYLEAVAPDLIVDLVTVTAYEVEGSRILVPQRVDPGRPLDERSTQARSGPQGDVIRHAAPFLEAIDHQPGEIQADLRRICDWALSLERDGLVRLTTYRGKTRLTLLPQLNDERVGLVTVWDDAGLTLSRPVFERRAPLSIALIEELTGRQMGSGTTARLNSDELLAAIRRGYLEAASTSDPHG